MVIYAHHAMLRTREKGFAYGAVIFAAILMGLMGIIVRNMSADVTIIASVRLSLRFVFLFGYMVVTVTTAYSSM
jgi:hypothetical protein